jgi:hypothetical protein
MERALVEENSAWRHERAELEDGNGEGGERRDLNGAAKGRD